MQKNIDDKNLEPILLHLLKSGEPHLFHENESISFQTPDMYVFVEAYHLASTDSVVKFKFKDLIHNPLILVAHSSQIKTFIEEFWQLKEKASLSHDKNFVLSQMNANVEKINQFFNENDFFTNSLAIKDFLSIGDSRHLEIIKIGKPTGFEGFNHQTQKEFSFNFSTNYQNYTSQVGGLCIEYWEPEMQVGGRMHFYIPIMHLDKYPYIYPKKIYQLNDSLDELMKEVEKLPSSSTHGLYSFIKSFSQFNELNKDLDNMPLIPPVKKNKI